MWSNRGLIEGGGVWCKIRYWSKQNLPNLKFQSGGDDCRWKKERKKSNNAMQWKGMIIFIWLRSDHSLCLLVTTHGLVETWMIWCWGCFSFQSYQHLVTAVKELNDLTFALLRYLSNFDGYIDAKAVKAGEHFFTANKTVNCWQKLSNLATAFDGCQSL